MSGDAAMLCTRRVDRREPLQARVDAASAKCRALDAPPDAIADRAKVEELLEITGGDRSRGVLLVGDDEERQAEQPLVVENLLQHRGRLRKSAAVGCVDHDGEGVGLAVVVLPVGAERGRATDVPQLEDVAVLHRKRAHRESERWQHCPWVLVEQLREDCSFPSAVEAEQQDVLGGRRVVAPG